MIGAYNSFTNPNLNLTPIEASINNPSGCLTVRFVSGPSLESRGWNASISCEPICQEIIAGLNANLTSPSPDTNYIAVCPGTEITFAADALFPQNNLIYNQSIANSNFEWVFGDGTTANGAIVTHEYAETGGYTVSLFVTDENGCTSDNSIETRVVIAGNPITSTTPPDPMCANDTMTLNFDMIGMANAIVNGTEFHEEISTTLGVTDTTYLPDGTGVCYETSVVFNCFNPGQTLMNTTDFLSLDVYMEHSFLGDLEISLICPNGQTMVIKEFADEFGSTGQGGGTFLGEPIDDGTASMGVGYHYSWTPISPTYGTMVEESASYGTLPEGSYEPYGTFADLVGCPLNGEWTIEVCDNWAIDDGYIFSWFMTLNPDIAPDTWEYTVPIDEYA
ncbi:MAG: PKD domain-containing protein [Bacteroidales bacterium]|nr:PKD domain-containing protein [Bacteroidales bacterium]